MVRVCRQDWATEVTKHFIEAILSFRQITYHQFSFWIIQQKTKYKKTLKTTRHSWRWDRKHTFRTGRGGDLPYSTYSFSLFLQLGRYQKRLEATIASDCGSDSHLIPRGMYTGSYHLYLSFPGRPLFETGKWETALVPQPAEEAMKKSAAYIQLTIPNPLCIIPHRLK